MSSFHSILFLSIVTITFAFPFPILRRNAPPQSQHDRSSDIYRKLNQYRKRSYSPIESTIGFQSPVYQNPWLASPAVYQDAFGPVAPRAVVRYVEPQNPVYGVPAANMWADALLQLDEMAAGNRDGQHETRNGPENSMESDLIVRRRPSLTMNQIIPEYERSTDDYEVPSEFNQEMSPLKDYRDPMEVILQRQQPNYDWDVVPGAVPVESGYEEEEKTGFGDDVSMEEVNIPRGHLQEENFKELVLPYLYYSVLEQQKLKEQQRLEEEKERAIHPQETRLSSGRTTEDLKRTPSKSNKTENNRTVDVAISSPTTMVQLAKTERMNPMARLLAPAVSAPQSTPRPNLVKVKLSDFSLPSFKKPVVHFDRGQEEVPLLRPPSEGHKAREAALKALSWPKELEQTDTEEQKRQLRQLPKEDVVESHAQNGSRRWPAVLDDVDDWLKIQLDSLKIRHP